MAKFETLEQADRRALSYAAKWPNKYYFRFAGGRDRLIGVASFMQQAEAELVQYYVEKHRDKYWAFFHKQREANRRVPWRRTVAWAYMNGFVTETMVLELGGKLIRKQYIGAEPASPEDVQRCLQAFSIK